MIAGRGEDKAACFHGPKWSQNDFIINTHVIDNNLLICYFE